MSITPQQATSSPGSVSAAISNLTVRLLSEYTGRGPTQARTYINENLISVVLQDSLTKGEQSLVAQGETGLVLENRKAYQRAMKLELISGVESLSGRRVVAFLSENHIDPDYAIESFVLAPETDDGDEPTELPV